jgi:DNA-binding NarL/FixJ family response regulator
VKLPVVAVINTNPDVVELLKARLETAGFVALILHVADIRQGLDLGAVLKAHDPQVIVYDVVMPYDRNYRFLQHLRETALKSSRFVLTTPNAAALSRIVGKDEKVYEVLDDRADIDTIVQAVREASRSRM